MNVEVLESSGRDIELRVEDTSVGQMNALRRTMMNEVPTLAIEEVTIYDNRSALFDEVIAHRLGLLPVPTDPSLFDEWDPDAEPETQTEELEDEVLYTLTYEGPGTVLAQDLKPASEDESAEIAEPEVPIVKLGRDQRLMLEATATLGTGSQHAKWQPVNAVGYRERPTVEVDGELDLDREDLQELKELAPDDALEFSGSEVEILDEVDAHDFFKNVEPMFDLENVERGTEDGVYILRFETDGSLTPKQALQKAVDLLDTKLASVHEEAAQLQ